MEDSVKTCKKPLFLCPVSLGGVAGMQLCGSEESKKSLFFLDHDSPHSFCHHARSCAALRRKEEEKTLSFFGGPLSSSRGKREGQARTGRGAVVLATWRAVALHGAVLGKKFLPFYLLFYSSFCSPPLFPGVFSMTIRTRSLCLPDFLFISWRPKAVVSSLPHDRRRRRTRASTMDGSPMRVFFL